MTEYRHGGDVYGNRNVKLDFSININPLGMPDFIKEAAIEGVLSGSRYPDSRCGKLREKAASFYQVTGEQIIFGNGAAELIYTAVGALKPAAAVVLAPSFTEYENALRGEGAKIHWFQLKEEDEFRLPTDEYLEFLSETKPDMVFLCNPANPAGNGMEEEDVERILAFCREKGIFVVMDECFLDFAEEGRRHSALKYLKDGNTDLMVLQALTKSFAMAGLRLGYGFLAAPGLLEKMQSRIQPWNVSIPAQEAGIAAFGKEREAYLSRARKLIGEEREYLRRGLEELGFRVFPSDANFLLFRDTKALGKRVLYRKLLERGILIRCCDDYRGLDGSFYRVCTGKRSENQLLLEALGIIYKRGQ